MTNGPIAGSWAERYAHSVMNTFGAPQMVLASGEGAVVVDEHGREYLDLLGGIAVNALGHAHPRIVAAVSEQLARLGHVSNFFATEPQIRLAERLIALAGAGDSGRVFFTNSGTEANECALKIVKAHAAAADRPRILALEHAFHGRSTGALSLTWKDAYRRPFAPLIPGVEFLPAGDPDALEAAMGPDVAGLFLEPIQGEAGVVVIDDDYLRLAREVTSRCGALLVVDEVQTGMGRTGRWLAHTASGIEPDVVTLAKGLGAGLPIGACLTRGAASNLLRPGLHGTTFGGNPVCAAAGLALIETIEDEGLLERCRLLGERWGAELRAAGVPGLVEVRGRGLLLGLEFDAPIAAHLVALARDAGFIINATGPATVRLAPPLILTDAQADSFTRALPALAGRALSEQQEEGAHA
ncbi:acetylornithine transaminase [Actinomyces sp. B33]|uniref:acetylornithine transaminase n=1 Tax=Actinomyces sp. B33 TaxID=2942131 RepID=UPI00234160C5|nr:acetylornithine transaminase [Actinomyces sp. B33]MDC4233002.1 acetylornithine transaminase [Actinomyces sp. B33]